MVGIDLGTTHTVVAFAPFDSRRTKTAPEPEVFPIPQLTTLRESEPLLLLPSCLYAPIAGELATLKRFDRPALERHHRRYYTSRMVVTVAGNFSRADVVRCVSEHFRLPRGKDPRSPRPPRLRPPAVRHART